VGPQLPNRRASKWMRGAVLVIVGLESAVMFVIVANVVGSGALSSSEALSRTLARAVLTIYGLPYLSLTVPALLLAALNRHLPIALALSLLVIPAVWLFFRYA
jgi:hypothetical protein